MVLIDVHAHYYFKDYYPDFSKLDFSDYGILILNGLDSKSNDSCLDLSGKKDNLTIKTAFGWHPLNVKNTEDVKEAEKELLRIEDNLDKIVAIGEIGLDYFHVKDKVIQKLQKEVFKMYLKAAEHFSLPIIVHARNSVNDVLDILEDFKKEGVFTQQVILHCFEASTKNIQRALGLGFYFTIPASIERQELFQRLVKLVPTDSMLTEGDAPYQGPIKGQPMKPKDIKIALDYIAKTRGLVVQEVENIILNNYLKIF